MLLSTSQKIQMIDSSLILSASAQFNTKLLETEILKFGTIAAGADISNPAIYCFGL